MNTNNGLKPDPSRPRVGISLIIQNLGHIPSFKNSKLLTRGRLITDPKKQKVMELITQAIESQLNSYTAIKDGETWMEGCQQSLIAWSKQFDDSSDWIPEIRITSKHVQKGNEGAIILIEEITP